MINALRFLFAASLVFALPSPAQQQPQQQQQQPQQPVPDNGAAAVPQHRTPLSQRLALTRDQRDKYLQIIKDRKAQEDAIRADSSLSPADRRLKIRATYIDANTKFRALLTPAQKEEYAQVLRERRAAARNRRIATPLTQPPANPPQQ